MYLNLLIFISSTQTVNWQCHRSPRRIQIVFYNLGNEKNKLDKRINGDEQNIRDMKLNPIFVKL